MLDKYVKILRERWGFENFRGIQYDIIKSIGEGKDTLGLMPTGGGKSITFQVPALAMDGVCIVITPLIALMKDQVMNLKRRSIHAAAIYSGMSSEAILSTLENCIFGAVKILYVSPERISSEIFKKKLSHIKVCLITVDEAHCISQWGYDFRPAYLQIADLRKVLPNVPVLALTATATTSVVNDIQEKLGFKEKNVIRMSFERNNLAYIVRNSFDKRSETLHILERIKGSAIVYVRSRQRAKDIAEFLNHNGQSATFYHAGLENQTKDSRQYAWVNDKIRVIVATNAFGMGIDKHDVRIVIHFDCPDCIESYFQEAGRAGRDGANAYAILLYNNSDRHKLIKRINDTYPDKEYIRKVYDHLAYFFQIAVNDGKNITFEFNIDKFCHTFNHHPIHLYSALKILEKAGYIEFDYEHDYSARVLFIVSREELYRLHNNSYLEDSVIVALLRNYAGLFCDYANIDENFIADEVQVTSHQIHEVLKQLDSKHIIHFIPRQMTPQIRYTQRRVDSQKLIFPKEIYDDRREQFATRINAMLSYITNDKTCRNKQLIKYFGELNVSDCGMCDVCLDRQNKLITKAEIKTVMADIEKLLSDKKRHHIKELHNIAMPPEVIDVALQHMINEEYIYQEDGFVFIGR